MIDLLHHAVAVEFCGRAVELFPVGRAVFGAGWSNVEFQRFLRG
jgi:hypothetical protein